LLTLVLLLPGISGCSGSGANEGGPATEADAPDVAAGEAGSADSFCPFNAAAAADGACPPLLPVCGPGELLLTSGTCATIGPRGCPALWGGRDDGSGCGPGELLPCPEGFEEDGDAAYCVPVFDDSCGAMEVPLLGGGCAAVGPQWGAPTYHEPHFDECPPFELAVADGGCAPVGPRACPKLWDPDSAADCNPGDLTPCPAGWTEQADGVSCDPLYDPCAAGELPLAGGGCYAVLPGPPGCPAGPFPPPPDGVSEVVHVDTASPCTDSCGGAEAPYATLQAAMDAVPAGGAVLVAAGTYDEGVVIASPVHLVGLCPAAVHVTGSVAIPEEEDSRYEAAAIAVLGASGVTIEGLSVSTPGAGLVLSGATSAVVRQVEVSGCSGAGLYLTDGSEAKAEQVWVHDLSPGDVFEIDGSGFWVEKKSALLATQCVIDSASGSGATVSGAGASLTVSKSAVRLTQKGQSGFGGFGLRANAGGALTVTDSLVEENRFAGIVVGKGSSLVMETTVIRDSLEDETGDNGNGIMAGGGSVLEVTDSLLVSNRSTGIALFDQGTLATVRSTRLASTIPSEEGEKGFGAYVGLDARMEGSGLAVEGNTGIGLFVEAGGQLALAGSLVAGTGAGEAMRGQGLVVYTGGEADLERCVFEANRDLQVLVQEIGSSASFSGIVVRDTVESDEGFGHGIGVAQGASAVLAGSLVERCLGLGVAASEPATSLEINGSVVRDTLKAAPGTSHAGVRAMSGAQVAIAGSVIAGSAGHGLRSSGEGTLITMSDSTVRGTVPDGSGLPAKGVMGEWDGEVVLERCLVEENESFGIFLGEAGATGTMTDSIVRHTGTGPMWGVGMHVIGSEAKVVRSRIESNPLVGAQVVLGGSLRLEDSLFTDNGHFKGVFGGAAVSAAVGSQAQVRRCLLEANWGVAFVVEDAGTDVLVEDSTVSRTLASQLIAQGAGFLISDGATVSIERTLVDESIGLAVAAVCGCKDAAGRFVGCSPLAEEDECETMTVSMRRSIVRGTSPDASWGAGLGLFIVRNAEVLVEGCVFEDNTTGGIYIAREGAVADVLGTVVKGTRPSPSGDWGMGMVLGLGAEAEVAHSLFIDNQVAGLLVGGDQTRLRLADSFISGTASGKSCDEAAGCQAFGDGVVAGKGATVELASTVFAANARCGVYYHKSAGSLADSVIMLNQSYGLALHESEADVDFEGRGNTIRFNALGLPEAYAADVTTSPEGLPAPTFPLMAGLGDGR
jgi:hypothetical protein